ncbi:hypothetical protein TW81_12590 [Vibrio galatheae]|uniref:Fimbrial protein n=1 Tax=Vibrio galatheae TaxID=579748 RepID=A0A0F4NHR6_9VIBR|nr:pilus assembly protein PilP [Vibrio galatheae]KJY82647.1 hypothetical protein TW81_12590 [Vibrio galatheae]
MNSKPMLLIAIGLAGCQAEQESLADFLASAKRHAQTQVQPLQHTAVVSVAKYTAQGLRQPFELPQSSGTASFQAQQKPCRQPDLFAYSGQFSRYPLSQLRFKGTMMRGDSISALIASPSGNVKRIESGQRLGEHQAKVKRVTKEYVLVEENRPDSLGCWQVSEIKLALK